MSDQWSKPQTRLWAPPSLSRQWLVRVANHTLWLIQDASRFSTNIRSVRQTFTDTLLSTTQSFLAVLVRTVNHTLLLLQGVSRFSTNVRSVSQTLADALLSTTESFSIVTRARVKSQAMCTVVIIQQLPTSCVQATDDGPYREIMLLIGKPKGRSIMTSNVCTSIH